MKQIGNVKIVDFFLVSNISKKLILYLFFLKKKKIDFVIH